MDVELPALAQVELGAVRPDGGGGEEELRLGCAVLPLRLRIDQAVAEFLQARAAPSCGCCPVSAARSPCCHRHCSRRTWYGNQLCNGRPDVGNR